MALPKGPAQEHLEKLDSIFGPEYFEHGRLLVTVARDVAGAMKVAHKLQSRLNEQLGSLVEVIFEHVKHELWARLHEATSTVGLHKGPEVPECQVTHIPDGIRQNPYQRDQLPSLEVLLLWDDSSRATHGHCLYTLAHPECPSVEQVDEILEQILPFFAKRWVQVELRLSSPSKGSFEDDAPPPAADVAAAAVASSSAAGAGEHEGELERVGGGVMVTVLACHAYGSALEHSQTAAPHVRNCQPLSFRGMSDDSGLAKICFLPAEINKIQVAESERFHGAEVVLPMAEIRSPDEGPTPVSVRLMTKALASLTVHVFALPRKLPSAEETDGVIDWASEVREPIEGTATVVVEQLKDGEVFLDLVTQDGGASFVAEDGLPEGCVNVTVRCPGYQTEERAVMLLVGSNELYIPLGR